MQERAGPRWYVSYAWGDDRTPEGRDREQAVEEHISRAKARGRTVIRDKDAVRRGDRISAFMRAIGTGDRIYVILSDKYLRSPFCMFELSEIWRNTRQDSAAFLSRIRAYVLPDAKIFSHGDRVDHAIFWKEEFTRLEEKAKTHGPTILGESGQQGLRLMQLFYLNVVDMLALIADQVLPKNFDEIDFDD